MSISTTYHYYQESCPTSTGSRSHPRREQYRFEPPVDTAMQATPGQGVE